jgi:hypothetical protein
MNNIDIFNYNIDIIEYHALGRIIPGKVFGIPLQMIVPNACVGQV